MANVFSLGIDLTSLIKSRNPFINGRPCSNEYFTLNSLSALPTADLSKSNNNFGLTIAGLNGIIMEK